MPVNNYYTKSADDTLHELNVDPKVGLSKENVLRMEKKYGKNQFSPAQKVSLSEQIIDSLKEPMVFILLVAAIISIGMNLFKFFNGMHSEFTESIGIIAAISISVGIQILMEGKSAKAFDALNNINDDIKVKVLRNGDIDYIHKRDIVVGDIVKLEVGDKVPADGRLIDSLELKLDESMLTGESTSVTKNFDIITKDPKTSLSERTNMVFSGTFVTYGHGSFVVTAVGDNTEMGNIASELKNSASKSTPLQEKLGKLAKTISTIGVITAGIVFLYELFKIIIHHNVSFDAIQDAFMTSVALIVAAVPEGLPTIVAIALSLNIIKMAKTNALVRKLIACETVGCINVICSDKTGTLTKNQMTVMDVWNNGELISPADLKSSFMIENFTINSTADISTKDENLTFIGNPTEGALLKAFGETICSLNPKKCPYYAAHSATCSGSCKSYAEIATDLVSYNDIRNTYDITYQYPFSSDKKSMTTVILKDNNYKVYTKGSPEKIISLCTHIIINDEVQELTSELKDKINSEIVELQKEAKRILAFSHKTMEVKTYNWQTEQNAVEGSMIFDGFVSIADPLRDDVYEAIEKCKSSGIGIKVLTGDNIVTAASIAKQLNMITPESLIVEAKEIDEMSDEELLSKLDRIVVIARSKPLTKMRIVNLLKKKGNVVAVTGDGINDAPALKNADVGIAMGITGTEVSKEASDIILLDDSFSTIVKAVEWGRGIYENFQRFIQFQLTVNLVAMLTVIICEIMGRELPFSTLQLLWVNLIMDGPPALSLGLEALRDNLMDKKPVKRDANIITNAMFSKILLNGLFIVIMLMALITTNTLGGTTKEQSSIVFTVFVMFQLFNAFNSRELGNDSIFKNLLKNKTMLIIIGLTFLLQIAVTQLGGKLFKTVPLSIDMWGKIILYSFTVIVFSEVIRFFKRVITK